MNSNKKLELDLLNILHSLNGNVSKNEFNQIVKFYQWDFNFKKIHVVGTNGKGSNVKYISDELKANGFKVGSFTSPHVKTMYERIQINNQNIDYQSMLEFVIDLRNNFPDINFGWFDIFFLTSLYWFHKNKVDIAVFEAGIGAKKDIVNFINCDYLIITSISYDHMKLLGNTLTDIAYDKSYAIKENEIVYISDAIDKELINIFKNRANQMNAIFNVVNVDKTTYETKNVSLSKAFLNKEFNIKEFKSSFSLPLGRAYKLILNNIECYVDIAHNIESFTESLNYFKKNNINFNQVLVSLSNDKDDKEIFKLLDKNFKTIYVYENKGMKPKKLDTYQDKYRKVLDLKEFMSNVNTKTLFIGSFYLVGEILNY